MFKVISVEFDLRNTLPKLGPFLLGHPVYTQWQMYFTGGTHREAVAFAQCTIIWRAYKFIHM